MSRTSDKRPARAQMDLFAPGEPVTGSLKARRSTLGPTTSSRTARLPARVEPATPFLKWAGGKTQLLGQLMPLLPRSAAGRYHEPFIGGGALFFALQPPRSYLSDLNPDLVNCYQVIRGQVEELILALDEHVYEQEHYYEVRAQEPAELDDVARAARFIFLNRTCFNGLHRVNRKGQFNVPFGRYSNPTICDADNLRRVSGALRQTDLTCSGFERVLDRARAGDLVYFNPPYQPISATSSFTSYTSSTFGPQQQKELAGVFRQLDAKGVKVMLSNSDAQFIRNLYADFEIDEVQAHRNINRDAARRGPITELVVRNFRT